MANKQDLARLGTAVRRKRQQKKLSQLGLAQLAGISNSQLNNVESARNWPSLPAYLAICRALGVGEPPLFSAKPATVIV